MIRFSKLVAVLAALPIMAVSGTALADSPGQLTQGPNTFMVKNLTQNGAYANTISAACNEEVQYSIRLHNAAFGGLTNVHVSANIMTGKMTAVPAEGASQGTTDTVDVNLPTGGSIAYIHGSTVLYNVNGQVIKNLPDGITTAGVNVGNISGSTTEFVNFKAKVACPPVTPSAKLVCTELSVNKVDRTRFDFTARASAENTTITSYVFTTKNSNGNTVDSSTVNTNAVSAVYHFNQPNAGTYTVSSVVNAGSLSATSPACVKQVTVEAAPVTPAVQGKNTLPDTGVASVAGIFAGASALGAAAHYAARRFYN